MRRDIRLFFGQSAKSKDLTPRYFLESALAMPSAGFAGGLFHKSLAAMAAAYLFHICKNHPFFEGNKRVAVVAAEIFLNVNGMRLNVSNEELKGLCLGVAAGEISKSETVAFFEKHTEMDEWVGRNNLNPGY